ncbi:MAG: YifB family Mg chelatase-like AAA ATPase [Alphaproteobacteria bacterium]|nr:YifB family Mg chelatase-like AAA ATPase [Alphaproteobacteria bacterium]
MIARVSTVAFVGVKPCQVEVQVRILPGLPAFTIVGLADKAVVESRERIRSALNAIGLSCPSKRVTINLAPADLPKEGTHYDLPIALALMVSMGVIPQDALDGFIVLGELALDGSISRVAGALPAAIDANARNSGLICPADCGPEAAWADPNMSILAPRNLVALVNHFSGTQVLSRPLMSPMRVERSLLDLRDVKGQESAKHALEVAAAGGHNLLMIGPPGSGKSMLAMRLLSILPPLSPPEMLEVSMIHSLAGHLDQQCLSDRRPFRSPHHSSSMGALIGGGHRGRPGEVSLAHLGVLFLDELPEFPIHVLDSLRQPLENGEVAIARVNHRIVYPARVQLVAAMNPCRCGMSGMPGHVCMRGSRCVTEYVSRLSGPFLDRIDLQIVVPAMSASDLLLPAPEEGSAEVALRVASARKRQIERFTALGLETVRVNALCPGNVLEEVASVDSEGQDFLRAAFDKLYLSARAYHRVLKVARTLADLEGEPVVLKSHLAEALHYRRLLSPCGSGI